MGPPAIPRWPVPDRRPSSSYSARHIQLARDSRPRQLMFIRPSALVRNLELGTVSSSEVFWYHSYETQCITMQRQRRLIRLLALSIGA